MAGIVRVSLIDHLTSNELLSGRPHGFVSGRSCATNLLATLEDWTSILDFESSVDIYLDFSKAFHSVRHGVKLRALGLQSEVLAWIDGFLMDICQRVCVNG